jgi:hypothetical protein
LHLVQLRGALMRRLIAGPGATPADWQAVAVSQTEDAIAVILATPVMIDAYRSGVPANGKPFPDGSKIAKIHWVPARWTDRALKDWHRCGGRTSAGDKPEGPPRGR